MSTTIVLHKYIIPILFLFVSPVALLYADGQGEYFSMSLEELLDIQIISASRQEQTRTELAIPVSVITAEEIHASGLTTIPEILQLAPGVDVRRVDRYRYLVGVRGMTSFTSDRTLVLIDGRDAMDPVYGMPHWLQLPVLIEDIERIEILRGPGGAAWGANAFTGVINIITKKPANQLSNLFSTTINEYGDTYNHLRMTGAKNKLTWRISAGYEDMEDSDDAGAGRTISVFPDLNLAMGFSGYRARDFSRTGRFDTDLRYDYSDATQFSLGAAYSCSQAGDRESTGRYPMNDVLDSMTRLFARADHQFDEDTSGHLQWFGNYSVSHWPHITSRFASYENDLEAQLNTTLSDQHSFTIGGNLRWIHMTADNEATGEIIFGDGVYDEYWAGLFVIDRIELTERLSVESQARMDRYNKTGTDWSLRMSTLYALDEDHNHVLRAGFARAFRAPNVSLRDTTLQTLPIGMGMYLFNVIPSQNALENEHTYAVEGGYTGKYSDRFILQVNTYYQRMEHVLGSRNIMAGPITNSYFANKDGAKTYGGECELSYKTDRMQLTGWYTYNEFITDKNDQVIRAYFPARHKAGLRSHVILDENWSLNTNYIYNDDIHINASTSPSDNLKMFHRLDINLARQFAENRGQIMVGVADVLNKTRGPVYDVNYFTSYETPGRTFFARLQYRF